MTFGNTSEKVDPLSNEKQSETGGVSFQHSAEEKLTYCDKLKVI